VIKNTSDFLSKLEDTIAGCDSKDLLVWTDDLHSAFTRAQEALPRSSDQLWIVTNGALRKLGLGATLYVERNGKLLLDGFLVQNSEPTNVNGYHVRSKPYPLLQLSSITARLSFSHDFQLVFPQTANLVSRLMRSYAEVNFQQALEYPPS
jgi:hypothetical protein